jgi:hypothetical protein
MVKNSPSKWKSERRSCSRAIPTSDGEFRGVVEMPSPRSGTGLMRAKSA